METYYVEVKSAPSVLVSHTRRDGGRGIFVGEGGTCTDLLRAALDAANLVWQRPFKLGRAYIAEFGPASLAALKEAAAKSPDGLLHPDRRQAIVEANSLKEALGFFESRMHWPMPGGILVHKESRWEGGGFRQVVVRRRRPADNKSLPPEKWEECR